MREELELSADNEMKESEGSLTSLSHGGIFEMKE